MCACVCVCVFAPNREPFVTVHALGKAVSRAKKLADGVVKRRGDDVQLDVSTESVVVFDDVFPSGENLEVR